MDIDLFDLTKRIGTVTVASIDDAIPAFLRQEEEDGREVADVPALLSELSARSERRSWTYIKGEWVENAPLMTCPV